MLMTDAIEANPDPAPPLNFGLASFSMLRKLWELKVFCLFAQGQCARQLRKQYL